MNEAAFARPQEAALVDALRERAHPYLSLVADQQDAPVVGHIFFSPVRIDGFEPPDLRIAGLGPVAVLSALQRRGIGSLLVERRLIECKRAGFGAVVVLGDPAFYRRFGFVTARDHGLRCEYNVPAEAFMATELTKGALDGVSGIVNYHPAFADL